MNKHELYKLGGHIIIIYIKYTCTNSRILNANCITGRGLWHDIGNTGLVIHVIQVWLFSQTTIL